MAHLWVQEPRSREWMVAALLGEAHAADSGRPVAPSEYAAPGRAGDALVHDIGGIWVLIASPAVRVNGEPLYGGVRVLRDRDEVVVGARRTFFSEEEPPAVVPFPGADRALDCARCKQPLTDGEPAVRCACGLWHHQTSEFPCWLDFALCAGCDRPTALEAGYRWSPESL